MEMETAGTRRVAETDDGHAADADAAAADDDDAAAAAETAGAASEDAGSTNRLRLVGGKGLVA